MRVLIVGGGVIGCAIAYELSRAGAEVILVERRSVAAGASSAAAGMLAPLAESSDPGPFSRLALQGLGAFNAQAGEIVDESGIDFEFRRDGVLRVAETADETRRLRALAGHQKQAEWLDRRGLRGLEPLISASVAGALYSADEGHVNPSRLTAALAAAAVRRGATVLEGKEIRQFDVSGARIVAARSSSGTIGADQFVLAGGAWLSALADAIGIAVPVEPVRGQMAAVRQAPPSIRHIVYSQDGYLVPKPDGSTWIGATEEHDAGFNATVTVEGLRSLLAVAERLVPALAGASYIRSWAGLRPCLPDRLPALGNMPNFDNLYVAAGHFRNGILLSLITGGLIAKLITTGVPPPELAPFSPARFGS